MPVHNFRQPRGRVESITVASEALRGNLLGDPHERTIAVYLPEGYDDGADEYSLFVGLAGFTGSGLKLLGWQGFGESVPQRADRLVEQGAMGPVILAFPDCFTALGGNQYVNSAALGRWEDFLLDDMIPAIESRFRVRRDAPSRAVFGRSSGGYGALIQAFLHADRWGGVACHSADINFDLCYRPDMAKAVDELARHGGDVTRFIEQLRSVDKIAGSEMYALMLLAMAATYDPDPDAPFGVRLPVDPHTCQLLDERWQRWLEFDPLRMVERLECQDNLRRLPALFIDCGSKDQYGLHYGARALVRRLKDLGIDLHYEEFDDNHSGIDYRMDRSLPFLYEAVSRV
jgi:enterochelin esterase-like enzyme